eukprot:gene3881-4842_t
MKFSQSTKTISMISLLVSSIVLFSIVEGRPRGVYPNSNNVDDDVKSGLKATWPIYWFVQTLDHFDPTNTQTFKQRYYVNSQYYDPNAGGPILLYINGEGPVSSPPNNANDAVVIYAKALGAMIVTLEHRYYGDSSPFEDLSTENLKYLTSQQGLNDLATFISWYQTTVQKWSGKVVTIGGSYSGALSAWFRVKYPHITSGSIASSGVVNAILDFTAFDEWVAYAAGGDCATALRLVTKTVESYIFQGGDQEAHAKTTLKAEALTDNGDFFYWLADSMAEGIQYGYHSQLCDPLIAAMSNQEDMLQAYANYTINIWTGSLGTPDEYATSWQQNTTHDIQKADRQWWWQTCSQLAYFQNAPEEGSIRSSWVNMTYHQDHCANVFGSPIWPNVVAVNEYYGGAHTEGTNIFFINASQDPWSQASITEQEFPTEPAAVITCANCGHCVDLSGKCGGGQCATPNNIDEVRQTSLSLIKTWISQ